MTVGTVLSIVSALLALIRYFVEFSQRKQWIDEGTARTVLQALKDADDAIDRAQQARGLVRSHLERNPDSILRDDDGFKRPGD